MNCQSRFTSYRRLVAESPVTALAGTVEELFNADDADFGFGLDLEKKVLRKSRLLV